MGSETKTPATFKVTAEIPVGTIRDLLVGALEGGANYWIDEIHYEFGDTGLKIEDFRDGGKMTIDEYYHPSQLIPFVAGCGLKIVADDETYVLNLESLQRGLQVMADKYTNHYADFLNQNGDATTSDIFLQCCLFGETVYG